MENRRMLLKLTEGVFSRTTDFALWFTVFTAELGMPQSTSGQIGRAKFAADRFVEHVNYDVMKDALKHARRRGWLTSARRRHAKSEITAAGKKRLASLLPRYDETRAWDGRMHMVTYDIPEKQRADRDMLREYLQRLGCGKLQASVWITPYNPVDTIRSFIDEKDLAGTVIVSDMGDGAAIGEENLQALVVRVYNLEDLEDRYEAWLDEYGSPKNLDHWSIIQYLSILADDPQLPFALLPKWWKGDKAYHLVEPFLQKVYL